MFLLLEDGDYLELEGDGHGRLLLEEDYPNGYISVSTEQRVNTISPQIHSDAATAKVSGASPQAAESYE